jgi:hypothetical protein
MVSKLVVPRLKDIMQTIMQLNNYRVESHKENVGNFFKLDHFSVLQKTVYKNEMVWL